MKKPFLSYFRTMKDHRMNRKKLHSLENKEGHMGRFAISAGLIFRFLTK